MKNLLKIGCMCFVVICGVAMWAIQPTTVEASVISPSVPATVLALATPKVVIPDEIHEKWLLIQEVLPAWSTMTEAKFAEIASRPPPPLALCCIYPPDGPCNYPGIDGQNWGKANCGSGCANCTSPTPCQTALDAAELECTVKYLNCDNGNGWEIGDLILCWMGAYSGVCSCSACACP